MQTSSLLALSYPGVREPRPSLALSTVEGSKAQRVEGSTRRELRVVQRPLPLPCDWLHGALSSGEMNNKVSEEFFNVVKYQPDLR
jgi:hypothetical protein